MDRKRQKLTPGKNDVQKECQEAEIAALKRNLVDMEAKLMRVIAELEQVKEERAHDKIDFETEKCELKSKMDNYKEQCTELQSEIEKLQSVNEKLQNYLPDLESAKITVEKEKRQTNLSNIGLNSQITKTVGFPPDAPDPREGTSRQHETDDVISYDDDDEDEDVGGEVDDEDEDVEVNQEMLLRRQVAQYIPMYGEVVSVNEEFFFKRSSGKPIKLSKHLGVVEHTFPDDMNILRPKPVPRTDTEPVRINIPRRLMPADVHYPHVCFLVRDIFRTVKSDARRDKDGNMIHHLKVVYRKQGVKDEIRNDTQMHLFLNRYFLAPFPHYFFDFDPRFCYCRPNLVNY